MRFLFLAIFFMYANTAIAAPSVTGTTGTFKNYSTVTLSGSAFKAKASAAPIRYDDFKAATPGDSAATATGWWVDVSHPMTVTTSNARYTNGKSINALAANSTAGNASPYPYSADQQMYKDNIGFEATKKFYLNYWWYFDAGSTPVGFYDAIGSKYWQIKSVRLLADMIGGSFNADNYPTMFVDTQNWRAAGGNTATNYAGARLFVNDDVPRNANIDNTWLTTGWYNVELYGQMDSTLGAGDASFTLTSTVSGLSGTVVSATKSNIKLIDAANSNGHSYYDALIFDNYIGNVPTPPAYNSSQVGGYPVGYTVAYNSTYYKATVANDPPQTPTNASYWVEAPYGYEISTNLQYGNIYIDNAWSRVLLCDSDTWAARKHCEVQTAKTWGDTEVTVSFNAGSFLSGITAYLYVVDTDGAVNSVGSAVTLLDGNPDVSKPVTALSSTARIQNKSSITLTCSDDVSCSAIYACTSLTDTCTPAEISAPITVYPGSYLRYYSIDTAENQETLRSQYYGWPTQCR